MSQVEWSRIRDLVGSHKALLAIIALYLVLAGLYMWAMPPFEGPDEPQHLAYIEWLAEGKGFPPQGDEAWETPIEQEAGQSPFYYILASLPASLIDLSSPKAEFRSNPYAFSGVGERLLGDNNNRAIHYPGVVQPLAGGWLALYLARLITVSFGVLLVISTYGLARQVAPYDPPVAIAAALLVAVIPQVIFISSVASNDIPAAALSALMLWLLTRAIRLGLSDGRALGIGITFGLAVLTKSSAAALGPAIAVALAWFWLSRRSSFWRTVRAGLWLTLGFLLSAGWWLARSWILYRSPLGLTTHDQTPWAVNDPESLARFLNRWIDVFRSFWIALGWGTIRPEGEWVYMILLSLSLFAVGGLVIALVSAKERLGTRPVVIPVSIVVLLLAIAGVAVSLETWMNRVIAPYGRLMFPALGAIVVLLSIGWYALHRRLPLIVSGAVLVLALLSPFLLARPAFSMPEMLDDDAVAQLPSRIDLRIGPSPDEPVAILLNAQAQKDSVPAGQFLPIKLCWQPVRQTKDPLTVLVHIIGPENGLLSGRRTYPGLGHLPTTIWEPGSVFCDLVHVVVWEDLQRTLAYQIEVGMLDSETNKRIPIFGPDDQPTPGMFVDRALLVSESEPVSVLDEQSADGPPIRLVDFQVEPIWSPGGVGLLELEWATLEPLAGDYQVYVHLRDQDSGEVVAQADGPPAGGWFPTSFWPVRQVIIDQRAFPVPAELEPGIYELVVGLYDLESLEAISEPFPLGSVQIEP